MRTFLVSAYSIVVSERAHSELLRTVFKTFGNEKLTRLDSNHFMKKKRNYPENLTLKLEIHGSL